MRAVLLLSLLLPLAACATDEDAAGTSNPAVTTPAELPPSAADPTVPPSDVPADSATAVPE